MNYYKTIFFIIGILLCYNLNAQVDDASYNIDSLRKLLSTKMPDTGKLNKLNKRSKKSDQVPDYPNAMKIVDEALSLAKKANAKKSEGDAYPDIPGALQGPGKAIKTPKGLKDQDDVPPPLDNVNSDDDDDDDADYSEVLKNLNATLKNKEQSGDKKDIAQLFSSIGEVYSKQGNYTEALKNTLMALKGFEDIGKKEAIARSYATLGDLNIKLNKFPEARQYLEKSVDLSKQLNEKNALSDAYWNLSVLDNKQENYKGAYEYYKLYTLYKDSVDNIEMKKKFSEAQLKNDYQIREANARAAQAKKDAEIKHARNVQYLVIVSLAMLIIAASVIVFIQYRNNKQKQKANALLHLQNEKVETTLSELKSTQAQLIQNEKMASLGELTAGIAHEIQNPLNFVNNFSEVNKELLLELKEEIIKGNVDEVQIIANDVIKNEEKINHHGKRADAIVKGMLQHSRASTGQKELTDINALTEEYLRLSYHGLRAKDKSFNAAMHTDFDESIGKINIIPQDMGRVLLNLFNNAFYAVHERDILAVSVPAVSSPVSPGYKPTVSVRTEKKDKLIELTVKDNGNGIPQKVLDKIFQPFFTTKPTGEGTGLGLSLSYDIIKAHGGEVKIETKEGQGAKFIIQLPIV